MRKSGHSDNKSLKMFFFYSSIVLFFVIISLLIKLSFIIKDSRFDGKHQFILTISKNNKLQEVVKFNPRKSTISVLQIGDGDLKIIPDAKVDASFDLPLGADTNQTFRSIAFKYNSIKTNLTIFDVSKLIILSYKDPVQLVNKNSMDNFFNDELISTENISIQIINAGNSAGMGKKLGDFLGNIGFNVISITTSRNQEESSRIQYFDDKTYTFKKLEKLLGFKKEEVKNKSIADITIIIGRDDNDLKNLNSK